MIFNHIIYVVFVDGELVGLCEDEDYIWDIAQNVVNGTSRPLTDDNFYDRVHYSTIRVNRWEVNKTSPLHITDRYACERDIFCYDYVEAKNQEKYLNKLNLERERLEAKIRAMTL